MIPCTLGDTDPKNDLSGRIFDTVQNITHYLVENERSARRFLSSAGLKGQIEGLSLTLINKHSKPEELEETLDWLKEGIDVGVISEAGCPGIADPGANMVALAHKNNIRVIPLSGPSSIVLALMASGFSGQNFTFHGYIPKDKGEKLKKLREIEKLSFKGTSQIFIETPFRNKHLFADILKAVGDNTRLCIACDITLPGEYIKTQSVAKWKKDEPDIQKKPTIFIIG